MLPSSSPVVWADDHRIQLKCQYIRIFDLVGISCHWQSVLQCLLAELELHFMNVCIGMFYFEDVFTDVCASVHLLVCCRCWRRTPFCVRSRSCLSSSSMTVTSCRDVWRSLRCRSTRSLHQHRTPHTPDAHTDFSSVPFTWHISLLWEQINSRLCVCVICVCTHKMLISY